MVILGGLGLLQRIVGFRGLLHHFRLEGRCGLIVIRVAIV